MKFIVATIYSCLFSLVAVGQISMIRNEVFYTYFAPHHLYDFGILNKTNSNLKGSLQITFSSNENELIASSEIPNVELHPGINNNWSLELALSPITYFNTTKGIHFFQSQMLYNGSYQLCIHFTSSSDEQQYPVDCISFTIENNIQLELLDPCNGCQITSANPLLTWTSTVFGNLTTHYSLRICKILDGQSPEESQLYNIPLVETNDLSVENLFYNYNYPELSQGTRYSWQVFLWDEYELIKNSSIWSFYLGDKKPLPIYTNARIPSPSRNHNPYIYKGEITFLYTNRFNMPNLSIIIEDLTDASNIVYKNTITLSPFDNMIHIDLANLNLNSDNRYLLSFRDIRNQPYYLYFAVSK